MRRDYLPVYAREVGKDLVSYLSEIEPERQTLNETNDCSVVAVSVALGLSYSESRELLCSHGRRHRGGATSEQIIKAVRSTGATCELVLHFLEPWLVKCKTPISIEKNIPDGNYLVFTSKHVFAVNDGTVMDWTRGRKHRVKLVYRIKK